MARLNRGLSLKEAAELGGITPKTLKKYEKDSGKAKFDPFIRLLKAYGVSMDHIAIGKEDEIIGNLLKTINKVVA
ncbi:helix-turn-helix domain-containing protein [Paenibacillus lutimineralis]|nr:helix-turn-helix transcriptional regulator [Paenibacillus lutimineralis]